jgi:hypothetical protein
MNIRWTILPILALWAACAGAPAPKSPPAREATAASQTALEALKRQEPSTEWRNGNVLEADFDQDGVRDFALTGVRNELFIVGIVRGPVTAESRVWTLEFPLHGGEDALCSKEARIAVEPLEENEGPTSKGPRRGLGINLHDDLCDSFHIAWNPDEGKFEWWRL